MQKQQLQAEKVRILYKQVHSVLLGNISIALLFTIFLYKYTDNILVFYWLAVVIGLSAFRYVMLKSYNRQELNEKDVIWWGWFFVFTAFLSGCTWGATSIFARLCFSFDLPSEKSWTPRKAITII